MNVVARFMAASTSSREDCARPEALLNTSAASRSTASDRRFITLERVARLTVVRTFRSAVSGRPEGRHYVRVNRATPPLEQEPHTDLHFASGPLQPPSRDFAEVGARDVEIRSVPDDLVEQVVRLDAKLEVIAVVEADILGQREVGRGRARSVQPVVEERVVAWREGVRHVEDRRVEPRSEERRVGKAGRCRWEAD